jgi:hypothetical protein
LIGGEDKHGFPDCEDFATADCTARYRHHPGAAVPGRDVCASLTGGQSAAKPVHRFQAFYVPNGMAMEYWTPTGEGTAFEFAPIQKALTPYRDQTLMLSGLKASWNYIHAGASGSFLTGTKRGGRNEVEIIADVSMDQLLAKHFERDTQLGSLELAMDPPNNAGACTGNLSCVYTHTLSWRSPTQPLPTEWNREWCSRSYSAIAAARCVCARSADDAAQEHSGLALRSWPR